MITATFTIDSSTRDMLSQRTESYHPAQAEALMHRYLLEVFSAAVGHINARGGAAPPANAQITLLISDPPPRHRE